MLIAEDLLVLIADERTGRLRGSTGSVDYGLAAAVLCDLELLGRLRVAPSEGSSRSGRVVIDDFSPTGDPLLDRALRSLTPRDRTPTRAVRLLRKGLRRTLYGRLVDVGVLRRDQERVFGVIPVTRFPAAAPGAKSAAQAAVNHAFVMDAHPDSRTAALIACLAVVGMVGKVVPEVHPMLTSTTIRKRARGYLDANWAARAARTAYQQDASAASPG